MAQSFNMISVSLGEAERQKDGHVWTDVDYQEHAKYYNINPDKTHLNTVYISANGLNERDLVNELFERKMIWLNSQKLAKVEKWNDEHFGRMNSKTNKPYKKKSVDKRQMFPVGEYAGKGKRQLPYETFKDQIFRGNARAKEQGRTRTTVLQQAVVGLGDSSEWKHDPVRKNILDLVNSSDSESQKAGKYILEHYYFAPFLKKFAKDNPSLYVVQAVVHYDESHPHMQLTFLPHVAGKEYGGLGSVGYTTALKHDHPELKQSDIIGEFYRKQHNEIRNLIANQKSLVDLGFDNKMKLGPRKGSHKPMPVDSRKQMLEDVDSQLEFVTRQKMALDKREKLADDRDSESKHNLVDTIKNIEPDHILDVKQVKSHDKPAKVSTNEGYQQHLDQPVDSLFKLVQMLIQNAIKKFESQREELKKKRRQFELQRESELADAYQQGRADYESEQNELNNEVADEYKVSPDSSHQRTQNKRLRDQIKRNQRISQENSKTVKTTQKQPNKSDKKPDAHKHEPEHDDEPEL